MRHEIMLPLEEDQERKAQRGISDSPSEIYTSATTQPIEIKFCTGDRSAVCSLHVETFRESLIECYLASSIYWITESSHVPFFIYDSLVAHNIP
jgi:hypothetical protein